jgi:hypothetical protein
MGTKAKERNRKPPDEALSLTVVAEGVETQAQQTFLTDHACVAMEAEECREAGGVV